MDWPPAGHRNQRVMTSRYHVYNTQYTIRQHKVCYMPGASTHKRPQWLPNLTTPLPLTRQSPGGDRFIGGCFFMVMNGMQLGRLCWVKSLLLSRWNTRHRDTNYILPGGRELQLQTDTERDKDTYNQTYSDTDSTSIRSEWRSECSLSTITRQSTTPTKLRKYTKR